MSKRYPGNFITGNPVALSQTSNNGIWDLKDNYTATGNNTWQEADGIYEIGRSLRFRSAASAYLSKTPATTGNQKTWTWSGWVKLGKVAATSWLMTSGEPGSIATSYSTFSLCASGFLSSTDTITFAGAVSNSTTFYLSTNAIFRDPSAWYHITLSVDTTQATAQNRIKLYVNGNQVSSFSTATYPTQNSTIAYINNSSYETKIGSIVTYGYFDGYMTELNFIDGQQLDPSYFGYTDSITNIWQPKKYTGSYGTNGFYLPFSENQTTRNLGRNFAGNTNFCPYSESVNSWGNTNCTITSNSVTAPNGTLTADTVTANSTASAYMRQDTGINMGISTYYTMSVYFKAGTATTATLSDGYGTGAWVTYNLTNGVVTGAYNPFGYQEYTITAVGNGWYRATNSFITHSSGDYNIGLRVEPGRGYGDTGASGASVYVWGAQINLGKTADAYFPNDVSTRVDNNFTANNFSLTAGTTYDSMVDSPTNVFTTATDTGGVVPGNYCTINAVANVNNTISNGGLSVSTGGNYTAFYSTHAVNTGKWYFEITKGSTGDMAFGLFQNYIYPTSSSTQMGNGTDNVGFYLYYNQGNGLGDTSASNNRLQYNSSHYGAPVGFGDDTAGTVYGCTLDFDTSVVTVYRANDNASRLYWTMPAALTAQPLMIGYCVKTSWPATNMDFNFGQRPFTYTPPAGFKSINTTNMQALGASFVGKAAITPNKWMETTLYGGTGLAQNIVNNGNFAPDLAIISCRSLVQQSNTMWDTVRGAGSILYTASTSAELQDNANYGGLTAFNSNGFSLQATGTDSNTSHQRTNTPGASYLAWQWKQSPTSGFNIVSYTQASGTTTVSHNLGVTPGMMIFKPRSSSNDGFVWHKSFATPAGDFLRLQTTDAVNTTYPTAWGAAPTSSNFSVSNTLYANGTTMIAYLWAEVPGFSKFGSYVGNASTDGPFVYTGFKPKWLLFKGTTATAATSWLVYDTARNTINPAGTWTYLNDVSVAADQNISPSDLLDITSNGFKVKAVNYLNNNGDTYIYAAFAESPFALNNRAR
jgi:hypothetical protein